MLTVDAVRTIGRLEHIQLMPKRIDGRIRLSHFIAESSDQFRYRGVCGGSEPLGPNAAEGLVLLPERQQLFRVKESVLESRQPVFQPVAAIEGRAHLC